MPLDFARDKRGLFLATLFVIALLTKTDPGSAHELSRYGTVESLVDRATFQLDDSSFIGSIDKIYRDGHYYSHQPPLLAVLEAPVYWAINLPGIRFNNRGRFVMTYAFILLTNGIALVFTVMVMARLLARAGVRRGGWLTALLVFGTWLLPYGIISNNHGISALLVAILIHLLYVSGSQSIDGRRAFALGLLLGLLIAIELLPLVSFAPLVMVYLALRHPLGSRGWAALAIGLAAPLVAHALLNVSITGDVIPAGFHHELFDYPGSVFDSAALTGSVKYDSVSGAAGYAWKALVAEKGFFTFAPLLLLAVIAGVSAWNWWASSRGLQMVIVGSIVLSLGASLLTTNNYGGEAVGFRHAVYLTPALLALLLPWLTERSAMRRVVIGVAALSTILMLIFAAPQPWSVMTLSKAAVGSWDQYVPIAGKIVRGELFNPR